MDESKDELTRLLASLPGASPRAGFDDRVLAAWRREAPARTAGAWALHAGATAVALWAGLLAFLAAGRAGAPSPAGMAFVLMNPGTAWDLLRLRAAGAALEAVEAWRLIRLAAAPLARLAPEAASFHPAQWAAAAALGGLLVLALRPAVHSRRNS